MLTDADSLPTMTTSPSDSKTLGPLFDSALDRLIREAPPEARTHLERLWSEPVKSIEGLRAEVVRYIQQLTELRSEYEFLDLATAQRIASQCLAHLSWLEDHNRPDPARLIQVAVRYFVEDEDAESDLSSPIGFDDDAAVVEAVARVLGTERLLATASEDEE